MSATPVIDIHSHLIPDAYWSAIESQVVADSAFADLATRNNLVPQVDTSPMRDVTRHIAAMDAGGVDISVISLPPPGTAIRSGDAELSARINDDLVAEAARFSDRLRIMCTVPLPDVEASIRELERVSQIDLVRGVAVTTNLGSWRLDDAALEPVYARMAELDLPLFVHPALEPLPSAYDDFSLTAGVSPVVSTTLGVLRMIHSGALDRVPGLIVIMPHLGGTIPFLLQRLVDLTVRSEARYPLLSYFHQRIILDTCSYHPPAFRCAADTVGVRRLTLGTDFPFRGNLLRGVEDIRSHGLGVDDEAAVLGGTVARWFA